MCIRDSERSVREVKKKWSCLKYAANVKGKDGVGQLTGGCPNSSPSVDSTAVMELIGDVTANGIDTCDIISKPGSTCLLAYVAV